MKHNNIRHMLSEYLDGSVSDQEKVEVEAHLKTCAECENALSELRKTIEQIKSIEEIDPPAWMTQKIMARVRTEAPEKKGLFQRLFFPLSIKLPIQAVAVAFLTITVLYVYRDSQPTLKFAETPAPATQESTVKSAKKEAPPTVAARPELNKADDSMLRSKQVLRTPGYKALDMKQEYEAPASPPAVQGRLAESAPAQTKPAEQLAPAKKELMEKRAAAPQASTLGITQEETSASAGAAAHAKAERKAAVALKKAKESSDTGEAGSHLERDIVETQANGKPKLVITYEVANSQKKKLVEERFNSVGERHGIQKEYYDAGRLKTEAQYEYGKLVWYTEYGPDGVKKTGKTDYNWFWLKK
jgi:hypothetical protein